MAEPKSGNAENIIFGAEFDGQKIKEGVKDVVKSLEEVQEAEALVKQSITETTKAMKENRKAAEELAKSKPFDPKEIEKQATQMHKLNEEYDDLVQHQAELTVVQKKLKEVSRDYNKTQKEQEKDAQKVSKAVSKFTNVNEIAADGIKKMGNFAKDAAFGLVSGFAGGIVASVLPSLIEFAEGLINVRHELSEIQKDTQLATDIQEKATEIYSKDLARLELLRGEINNTNNSNKQRIALIKEYNKTADEGNRISETELNNTNAVNAAIDRQIALIKQRAIAKAAENIIAQKAEKLFKLQLEREERFPQQSEAEIKSINDSVAAMVKKRAELLKLENVDPQEIFAFADIPEETLKELAKKNKNLEILLDEQTRTNLKSLRDRLNLIDQYRKGTTGMSAGISVITKQIEDAQKEFDRALRISLALITPEGLISFTKSTEKTIENVFEQKLHEFRARLANVSASVFQSEGLIRDKFREQLNKEFFEIGKLLKEKKLTEPQADILRGVLEQINEVELEKGLQEFRKKREEAMKKINDILIQLNVENETKRIQNLRDEFAREREQIDFNFEQSIAQIHKQQKEFLKTVDEESKKGLISPEMAKRKKFIAAILFGDLLNQAAQAKLNAEAELAFKNFQKTLELTRDKFEGEILGDNENTTRLIREQVGLFLQGSISYEKYQKNLTEILKRESRERKKVQLDEAKEALRLIDEQLKKTTDPKQIEQLNKQRDQLRGQISSLTREIATGTADEQTEETRKRINTFIEYVKAVNDLAASIVSFWQQVNQAEAAALDRSIALQNKRVENAREIAEAGNAEYLEMEQKRLDELDRKREANARKQLAVNNALAASQAIVAAISAIAQAVQTGSALSGIAALAAVIGAIGAAYSFVNSLQPQEANFFTGEEFVHGPEGKDKVKANLTKGERVVTARDNKDYWGTLHAIHTRAVPPDVLNAFVERYPDMSIPMVDFSRLASATEGNVGSNNPELLSKVGELQETMERMVAGLHDIGINVRMDEHGFEASISKARRRRLIRKLS